MTQPRRRPPVNGRVCMPVREARERGKKRPQYNIPHPQQEGRAMDGRASGGIRALIPASKRMMNTIWEPA